MTRFATLLAAGLLAGFAAAPVLAFGADILPLLTYPSDAQPQGDTPTRGGICLLCPATPD
ncbi:hypothetical protein [Marinovum sp.]|uniref:hypothetical protein n=1 Tax=Marinovum sp. TaxID=2024839 RepID=UPI003A8EF2CD